jgi:hypothetical protein
MSSTLRAIGDVRRAVPAWQANLHRLSRCLPFLLVLAAALLMRRHVVANVDVSWMLTVAEKLLDGQRLYVDVIEVNPPAAVFLYVPPVAIARAFGLRPETVADAFVLAAACLSIWLAGRVLARARLLEVDGWHLAALVAAILTILPAHTFGNRDPVALIAFLPALAVFAARSTRAPVPLAYAVIGGLSAAVTVMIKPHFVLAVVASAVVTAVCAKSWRALLAIENRIAGALVLAYAGAVVIAFPAFIADVVPVVGAVYVARPVPVLELMPAMALWLAALVMIFHPRRKATLDPPFCVLLAASGGSALAFLAQGNGWPYHSVPMLSLALLALAMAGNWLAMPTGTAGARTKIGLLVRALAAGGIVGASFWCMNRATDISDFVEKVERLKSHPSMLAITSEIALGHPLVREVGGVWVGRVCSNWIANGVLLRRRFQALDPATSALLDKYEALDRSMLAEDIGRARPDIILVDRVHFDWQAWARLDPALRERLQDYREADTLHGVAILQRRDVAARPNSPGSH